MARDQSRLRQRILELEDQRDAEVERVLGERGPLIRGSFGRRGRVCGNSGCSCTQGQLHFSKYLSVPTRGVTRQVHVPAADEERVEEATSRYRQLRHARARLAKLAAEQLVLVDELGNTLLAPYPTDEPVRPAGRRGRPAKKRHS